jgi:segregation and condensation protein B
MDTIDMRDEQMELFPQDQQDHTELGHIMEAVLFALSRAVEVSELAKACGCDMQTAREVIAGLVKQYDEADGALLIREVEGKYQMCTSPRYFDYLVRVVSSPKKP